MRVYRRRGYRRPVRLGQIFVIFIISLILAFGFYLLRNRDYFLGIWGGKGRLTVLVYSTGDSRLYSLDPYDSTLTIILIPGELYTEVPGGYGSYKFSTVYKLGELDKKGKGLVKDSVSEIFGIPVEEVILFNEENFKEAKGYITSFDFLKRDARFWFLARNIKVNNIRLINARELLSVSELLLPDNSRALKYDPVALDDEVVLKYLTDGEIVSEKLKIEVLNSTEIVGLGEKVARRLTNMGLTVLAVNNTSESTVRCKIKSEKKNRHRYSVIRLLSVFGCGFEEVFHGSLPRTDLALILGRDLAKAISRY